MINSLPGSLIDAATRVLTESQQYSRQIVPMSSRPASEFSSSDLLHPPKPTLQDSAENRQDPVWEHAINLNGSSTLLSTTDPENLNFEHLFYRHKATSVDKKGWEYGIKEKVHLPGDVKTVVTQRHIITRLGDPSRNYSGLSGDDFRGLKERVIQKINDMGLVGTVTDGLPFKEHHFISTKNAKTKGHTVVTRIFPSGKVHLTTLLDPTMKVEKENHLRTFVESIESLIEID